jgi:hypothetical protein
MVGYAYPSKRRGSCKRRVKVRHEITPETLGAASVRGHWERRTLGGDVLNRRRTL